MKRKHWIMIGTLFLGIVAAGIGIFAVFTGPRDRAQFPRADQSPYRLPWPAGRSYCCVQGVRGVVSHRGRGEFAYDFAMPVGSDVCAARAGTVTRVVVEHDGHGYRWPNNLIIVRHDDGTLGCYAHIRKEGSYVAVGDFVDQGQVIAASGHVGNSMMPHLHFHVADPNTNRTIPITFADVARDGGIPRMFRWYTSGNALPEP